MNISECIFFNLAKASQAGTQFAATKVAHLEVTAIQALVLNTLWDEDAVTSQALSQRLKLTSATMTGILDRLERLDLLERRPHPQDRRAILVCLTGRGRQVAAQVSDILEEANREFLAGLSPEEEAQLRIYLRRVTQR